MTTLQPGAAPANTRTPVTEQPSKAAASNNALTRRAAIAGLTTGAATVALAATPAMAAISSVTDPRWAALVADYRAKYAGWMTATDAQEAAEDAFTEACASFPPEPQAPGSGLSGDILGMTIAEIRAIGDSSEHKAKWAAYQRDHAAWKERRDALHQQIVGPTQAQWDLGYAEYEAAMEAIAQHRPETLSGLRKKIEIMQGDPDGFGTLRECLTSVLADVQHLGGEA